MSMLSWVLVLKIPDTVLVVYGVFGREPEVNWE